ncbi:phosphoglycerol transferase MdoB-like AlkP superfamily enzyme [Paenibacillus amylolyticus]|uniref:Phosphoglycerol transferase MdoB-like AlkP superfamily enzyme n=1 Tax=Paenibacillus amylolyticus TaxID=1451 RepID=A0AAP5H055_PAEAM|nr:LTA synthase family protein [Paenibacillus amylolyticus]MDR6723720.1 phosphoglycerol transferase MdoB-like AlkP superfamily enzyme [Paenibacillus amylolyticus]
MYNSKYERISSRTLFIVLFILLLLKLTLLRYFFFQGLSGIGLLTDTLGALTVVCVLDLIVPKRWKRMVYGGFNLIFSLVLFAATLYNVHFSSVPTYTALSELGQVAQVRGSIGPLIRPVHFMFFVDIVLALPLWFILRSRRTSRSQGSYSNSGLSFGKSRRRYWGKVGVALTAAFSIVLSGSFIVKGETIDNELVRAENLGFLNYQVSSAILTSKENEAIANGNINETIVKINQLVSQYPYQDKTSHGSPVKAKYFGEAKGSNLIVLQLESFQNFPIHASLGGQVLTPVLNELASESYYFPHFFQQIGQGNTSDAEFMSNTSIYPTGVVPMSAGYSDRDLPSLPKLLRERGYQSETFHGNDVTFWNRNKMYPAIGFDRYFDKPSFKNDRFNDFGPSDEELYRVGVEKMTAHQAANEPFYAQFITASSHSPFKVPADRARITVPETITNTLLHDYLQAINYTDYAVGQLINELKASGLWDNTTLVIYGDHFGLPANDEITKQIQDNLNVPYDGNVSRFNIPLIIHTPQQSKGQVVEQPGGQLDIMPTVLNLMGVSLQEEQFTAFGHDLLNMDHNAFGIRYYLPTGSFVNNEIMFVPGAGFDDGKAYSITTYEPVTDLEPYRADYEHVLSLMKLSDEYVKLLPKRAP